MSFAENIRKFRLKKQLSQPELARDAGVSKGYIYLLESGGMDNPSLEILHKIATALDVTVADLIDQPRVAATQQSPELPASLLAFAKKRKRVGEPLSEEDLISLAATRFRGKRPESEEDWAYLYEFFKRTFDVQ